MVHRKSKVDIASWWPKRMRAFSKDDPMMHDTVMLAENSAPFGEDSTFELFSGLVPMDKLDWVLSQPGPADWPLQSSGPHPALVPSGKPWFQLAFKDVDIEPLVVSWESGTRRIMLPDQGLLMTYGLLPRMIQSENDDEIIYDDLTIPEFGILSAKTVSHFEYALKSSAYVTARNIYIEDYSTIRDMAVVQFYFAHCSVDPDEIDGLQLLVDGHLEKSLPGRQIVIGKDERNSSYYCQTHGLRCIARPGRSPIIKEQFNVESLEWPGIQGVITRKESSSLRLQKIYVKDSVLAKFEERQDLFRVNPETGGVSFGGQWSVGYSTRVGRDYLSVELKKLYEGNLDHVIKHWHQFAVNPPDIRDPVIRQSSNVAKRSKRIAEALIELGQNLTELWTLASGHTIQPIELTGYDERNLRYHGFWENSYLFDIARQIPWDMGEDAFFQRCISLEVAIIEGLKESNLRKLLHHLGVPRESIKELRSLKLLYAMVIS